MFPSSNPPTSALPDDTGVLAALMPNRGRTRFLRGVILVFLGFGVFGAMAVGALAFAELYARKSWPVAPGVVTGREVKSNKGRPGNLTRRTLYWAEYEVRFGVAAGQCLTGTISADSTDPMPCYGTTRTRSTDSWPTVNDWAARYKIGAAVQVLHEPNGPGVKIVGESAWLVYPWGNILGTLAWLAFFSTLLSLTQRRLRFLETLPEDYDAASLQPSQSSRPDDPIDLKLS